VAPAAPSDLAPATSLPTTELVELTHGLRSELLRRGEFLPSAWVEEAATDLHRGDLVGWCTRDGGPALGFFSRRARRAYAHVHVAPGTDGVGRAERLVRTIVASLPPDIERADTGVTGLTEAEEGGLALRLSRSPEFSILERVAMNRGLTDPLPEPPGLPEDLQRDRVRNVALDALARLDWGGYRGSPDESLVADSVEQDRREIEEILGGRLGRFLDEASAVLIDAADRPVGMLLAAEQSPQRAIVLNVVVDPARRGLDLGRFLLRRALRAAAALGYREVRLWVTVTNVPARSLYESEGFARGVRALIYRFERAGAASGPQPQTSR